jgi:hypothetical protein
MKFDLSGVMILKVEQLPWEFSGREGTSYKVRILYAGSVFTAKADKDFYERFALVAEEKGTASFLIKPVRVARDNRVVEYVDLYVQNFVSDNKEASY